MIRLIVSDIDGTLVTDGGSSLPEAYYETILRLKEKGIYFAAASGRQATGIENIFKPIREKIFYIGDNGAYLGCYGRNLFMTEYRYDCAGEVFADLKAAGLNITIDTETCVYASQTEEGFMDWLENGYHFRAVEFEDISEIRVPYMKISGCRMNGLSEAEVAYFHKKYDERLKITLAGVQWLDTMALSVNKGNAVKLLQDSLDISPRETMAFGDQQNDIEMLNQAYYSFAVANARPETIRTARFLADSDTENGVLKILQGLL